MVYPLHAYEGSRNRWNIFSQAHQRFILTILNLHNHELAMKHSFRNFQARVTHSCFSMLRCWWARTQGSWGFVAYPARALPTPLAWQPHGSDETRDICRSQMQLWQRYCSGLRLHLRSKGGVVRTTVTLALMRKDRKQASNHHHQV